MASVMALLGLGNSTPLPVGKVNKVRSKNSYVSTPKLGSINSLMKVYREREHGTMSRRIARQLVKAIKQDDKKSFRIAERKSDPERHLRFA